MAIKQKLKGDQNKTYDVLINFNKGIDRKSADDIANDSSFRKLTNFWNEKEGILTKRPGMYDTYFTNIIEELSTNGTLCGTNAQFIVSLNGREKLQKFNDVVLKGNPYYYEPNDHHTSYNKRLIPKNIIAMQVLKDNNFSKLLENYNPNGNNTFGTNNIPDVFEFNALFLCGCKREFLDNMGEWESTIYGSDNENAIIITKLCIKKRSSYLNPQCIIEQVTTATNYYTESSSSGLPVADNNLSYRWGFNLSIEEPLDLASYNGYTYIPTGANYIIRVKDEFPDNIGDMNYLPVPIPTGYNNTEAVAESDMIVPIGGLNEETLYKPTPIEVSNIGFNILANNPLSFVETGTGTTDAVTGVFYTYTSNSVDQPIEKIPSNSPFNIHILSKGESAINVPEYRIRNGDTDITTNPYKNLEGSFDNNNNNIFHCTGINVDGEIELKVTKGNTTFTSYVETGSEYTQETGNISDIKDLIYSSKHIKIINNQLVLYGGHRYIFFSDYDNFQYFPNYFFLYVATEAEEDEVTAIRYFRQYYAVFTNKRIKRMTGNFGSDNFGVYPLNDFVGCPNGNTIKQVNNNLLFLNIDGLYKLKQGYVGEGTENVEKIDGVLGNEVNSNNVIQSFVLNNYYIMVRRDKSSLMIYDFSKDAFFEFDLEAKQTKVRLNPDIKITGYKSHYYFDENTERCYTTNYPLDFNDFKEEYRPFKICFQNELFDEYGSSIYIPEYEYDYSHSLSGIDIYGDKFYWVHNLIVSRSKIYLRKLRMSDLAFLEKEKRHKDAIGFISEIETPKLNMGSPTNTKKFKELYIKMTNDNLEAIPLYISIYIDDIAYITPENYYVEYDSDTNTYYYVFRDSSNSTLETGAQIIEAQEVLGTLTLGEDVLGAQTIMQLKIKINKKGRSIKIILKDGFDDTSNIAVIENTENTLCQLNSRSRNSQNFSIIAMGIVYKLKKVKEG